MESMLGIVLRNGCVWERARCWRYTDFGREWIKTGHCRTKYCTRCVLGQDKGLNDFVGSALVAQDCEEG